MTLDISSAFKTFSQFTAAPPSLDISTHLGTMYPAAPPGRSMHLSTLPLPPPRLPRWLPSLFCCHMGRLVIQPGRGGGVLWLIRPPLLKELLLHRRSICLPRLALLLINAGHLLFSPALPFRSPLSPTWPYLVAPLLTIWITYLFSSLALQMFLIPLSPAHSAFIERRRYTPSPLLILAPGAAARALLLCTQTFEKTLEWKLSRRVMKAAQHAWGRGEWRCEWCEDTGVASFVKAWKLPFLELSFKCDKGVSVCACV